MRKLLFKSPEWSLEDGVNSNGTLPHSVQDLKASGDKLRASMEDKAVKICCEMTDEAIFRTRARSA